MSEAQTKPSEWPAGSPHFQTTQWNLVLNAAGSGKEQAAALEQLCRVYWYPVYAHIRRRGHVPHDAQDLAQEFFARLLEKNWLADVRPSVGRFRSFLLTAVNHFLANEYDRSQAAKRGGGQEIISLDQERSEERYRVEPTTDETLEKIFDRRWAITVLDRAMARLREEISTANKVRQYEVLNPFLSREPGEGEYAQIAQTLDMSVGAVGVAVYRLRQRYREVVREEIASTVADPTQIDEEMHHLCAALGR